MGNKVPTAAGGGEDRISELPDAIIHKILDLLYSPKQAAKSSVLSPRWFQLWRSYPILEFRDTEFGSTQSAERFAAAAAKKFGTSSNGTSVDMEAIRIEFLQPREGWDPQFCSAFVDGILELAAKRSPLPREIAITADFDGDGFLHFDRSRTYPIPRGLLLRNSDHQCRLKVLNLVNCNFDQFKDIKNVNGNNFVGIGSSLRELRLSQVSFPDDGGQILNSIIAGASLLQDLYLSGIVGIQRLQVRNLPNLKFLWIKECALEHLEITGVHSLELFDLSSENDIQVIEMDVPKLSRFHYWGRMDLFLTILAKVGSYYKDAGQFLDVQYLTFEINENNFYLLRKFLVQQTQLRFQLTLQFSYPVMSYECIAEEFQETLSIPKLECVKIPWDFTKWLNQEDFLNCLFRNFHPNYLSFTRESYISSTSNKRFLSTPEYICKQFIERDSNTKCGTACKCWRHRFKDMKIIKRSRRGKIRGEDGDQVMDISRDMCSSLAEAKQVMILLTWD